LHCFFGKFKASKSHSEINWPLNKTKDEVPNLFVGIFVVAAIQNWHFVTKIVLTYCEKELF
jgi:hypothetical protein